ncbi:uncharacterized protein MELLADRAFT_112202 [Melampsora larici-populina 98AG31]|uniref:Secreted protein n=1 Tax=Melampsora larici-populina (strain 98AG31 / pathotype 3-4-7) TaxID=747676 RepID=F4S5P9_MELLP|nr:uncharacterized protein MELLADRAFT_112202 [Melampsora larici-populina 98AG31]EGG00071.1 hypothetical protein MELLADRAFT_112202 [Melampsora larici-populina 98AG31]
MKSLRIMILMSNWPISLTATGIWDLSKTMDHPVPTTERYTDSWPRFTGPDNTALHQQEVSRPEGIYRSNVGHSYPQTEPSWLDTQLFNAHPSDAYIEHLGEQTYLEDRLERPKDYNHLNQLPGIKAQPQSWLDLLSADDFDGALHNDGFHSSSQSLRRHSGVHNIDSHDPLAVWTAPHIQLSQSVSGHHIPAEHLTRSSENEFAHILEQNHRIQTSHDVHTSNNPPPPILDSTSGLDLPSAGDGGARHHDAFHSTRPYNGFTSFKGDSEVHNEYPQHSPGFSYAPHVQISPSPSGHSIPTEHPIDFLDSNLARMLDEDDNFDTSLFSQTLNNEPTEISRDALWQPPVPQTSSSVSSGRWPLDTFRENLDHVAHDTTHSAQPKSAISDARPASELSETWLRGHSKVHNGYTHDPLGLSYAPHTQISQSPSGHSIPTEHPIDFLDSNLARMLDEDDNFDAPFGSQTLDQPISQVASSRPSVPQVISSISNGERPLEAFKDTSSHFTHSTPPITHSILPIPEARQASELPSSVAFGGPPSTSNPLLWFLMSSPATRLYEESLKKADVSLFRSGQLKRPFQTIEVTYPSLKQETRQNPSSFDDKEGLISQVKRRRPSKAAEIDTLTSSTLPNQKPSRLRSKPSKTPALDSKTNDIPKLPKPRRRRPKPAIVFQRSNLKAIEKYYGSIWRLEKVKKQKMLKRFDSELAQKFIFNANHPSISPRKLIDSYEPKIQAFLKSFDIEREIPGHTEYLQENMNKLLDNYLEVLAICSEVVFSNGLYTNMEDDVRDGYIWLKEKLKGLPETHFDYLPIKNNKVPRPTTDRVFSEPFKDLSTVYDRTVFWLRHRLYEKRRESVATTYALDFMRQHRDHWIKYLTRSGAHRLNVKTLMVSTNRVRPLKYTGNSTLKCSRQLPCSECIGLRQRALKYKTRSVPIKQLDSSTFFASNYLHSGVSPLHSFPEFQRIDGTPRNCYCATKVVCSPLLTTGRAAGADGK